MNRMYPPVVQTQIYGYPPVNNMNNFQNNALAYNSAQAYGNSTYPTTNYVSQYPNANYPTQYPNEKPPEYSTVASNDRNIPNEKSENNQSSVTFESNGVPNSVRYIPASDTAYTRDTSNFNAMPVLPNTAYPS